MRLWLRHVIVAALVVAFATSGVVAHAAAIPTLTTLKLSASPWTPATGALTVTTKVSGAGKWRAQLLALCTNTVVRDLSGVAAAAGTVSIQLDGDTPDALPEGPYRLTVTPLSSDDLPGTAVRTTISIAQPHSSPAFVAPICDNTTRLRLADTSDRGLFYGAVVAARQQHPSSTTVVLAPYSPTRTGTLAVTIAFARLLQAPVLLFDGKSVPWVVSNELKRRGATKVIVVGRTGSVADAVISTLKKKYAVPVRFAKSDAALAQLVYRASLVPAGTEGVFVNLNGNPKSIAQALAFASATARPLLDAGTTLPAATAASISSLKIAGGTAVGSTASISAATLDALPGVARVSGLSDRDTALALALSVTQSVETIALRAAVNPGPLDLLAFTRPALGLVVEKQGLSLAQRTWINSRGDAIKVTTQSDSADLPDDVLALVGYALKMRGEPTQVSSLQPVDLGTATPPATFAFSGAGWGHGVGMSQWGAYAMAAAGKSETEILQHYFTGTTVEPIVDSAEIAVGLCLETDSQCISHSNRVGTIKFGSASLGADAMSVRLQAADGTSVKIAPKHTVTFTYDSASGKVKTVISGAGAPTLAKTSTVTITWSGTRSAGTLGGAPGVVKIAGPANTLANAASYRYGSMRIKAAPAQGSYPAGLLASNRVRLHDEYLYGISEVSSSWPAAALRTQVIAARSYAYYDVYNTDGTLRARRTSCDCQLVDDVRDQNYVGWAKLSGAMGDQWKAAVDATLASETTGLVVKAGSTVAKTFFSAANGGYTQNNEDVWNGAARSYLRSVEDPWSLMPAQAASVAAWSPRIRTQAVVAKAFGLPDVVTIDLSNRFASGSLKTATATSSTGETASISGEKFRSAMVSDSGTTLMSTWVWRSAVNAASDSLTNAAATMVSDRLIGLARAPGVAAPTSAVLVQKPTVDTQAAYAAAAAFAGNRHLPFLVAQPLNDATRIKNLLVTQKISSVVVVGDVDPKIIAALAKAGIAARNITGATNSELAVNLARDTNPDPTKGVIVTSDSETSAWQFAVSASARTGRPLLFVHEGTLAPETSSYLTALQPTDVWVVGTTAEIPDSTVNIMASPVRLNTGDRAVAALTLLNQTHEVVRAVVLTGPIIGDFFAIAAAATGYPLLFEDNDATGAQIDWLRRQPLAAAVVDLGVTQEFAQQIRRA